MVIDDYRPRQAHDLKPLIDPKLERYVVNLTLPGGSAALIPEWTRLRVSGLGRGIPPIKSALPPFSPHGLMGLWTYGLTHGLMASWSAHFKYCKII